MKRFTKSTFIDCACEYMIAFKNNDEKAMKRYLDRINTDNDYSDYVSLRDYFDNVSDDHDMRTNMQSLQEQIDLCFTCDIENSYDVDCKSFHINAMIKERI